MKNQKISLNLLRAEKALLSLKNIAYKAHEIDRSNIDASIQRFEFTVELFWKLLRHMLEEKGVEVQYPKDVLRQAYKGGLIDDEHIWLKMLSDRNLTSHTYDEKLADEIYLHIQKYVPFFIQALAKIKAVIDEI